MSGHTHLTAKELGVMQDSEVDAEITQQHQQEHAANQNPQGVTHDDQPAWQGYNSVFTAAKAGMQNVDKEKVKKVVYEMSKNSAHFKNEQRKQAQVDAKITQLKSRAAALSASELAAHAKACDAKITQLEATRDLTRTWLHVDMDAFYASVEELEQPALKSKPMAVGGMGMICTANYEARKYGVRSAMPGFIARKLCPQLVFVKPDFVKYTAASEQTRAVFRQYDPDFEAGSLDEAYLDVTSYCQQHGMSGEQVATQLRAQVTAATQLTCSVGVAPNVTLAKVASDMNKPNGQAVVEASRDAVMAFIHGLPIRKVPGIGKVSEQSLNALGIHTCSQIIAQRALVAALLSPISCRFLLSVGLGLGATEHSSRAKDSNEPRRKGISCERTFSAMSAGAAMEQMAENLVQHLASDMASEGIEAKTLTLKLKTTAFEVRTRAVTLPQYVSTDAQMLPPILKLLKAELPVEIRLMGIRGSNLRKCLGAREGEGGRQLNVLQRILLQEKGQQQQQLETGMHAAGNKSLFSRDPAGAQQPEQQPLTDEEKDDVAADQLEGDLLDLADVSDHQGGHHFRSFQQSVAAAAASNKAVDPGQQQQMHQNDLHIKVLSGQQAAAAAAQCNSSSMQELFTDCQQQQQLNAINDPVLVGMKRLHSQVDLQQQQQQQEQQQCPCVEHPTQRVEVEGNSRYQQQGTGSIPTEQQQYTTAGQWRKASELLGADWEQQQQQFDEQYAGQLHQHAHTGMVQPHQQLQQSRCDNLHHGGYVASNAVVDGPSGISSWQASDIKEQQRQQSGPSRTSWTCLVCTYSDNKHIMLRCEMCDTPKGDKHAPSSSLQQNSSHNRSPQQQGHSRKASRARQRGGSTLSGKQGGAKQLKLDSVVLSGAAKLNPG